VAGGVRTGAQGDRLNLFLVAGGPGEQQT
jgi:hypothetical protein